jgi:hypothetical protein
MSRREETPVDKTRVLYDVVERREGRTNERTNGNEQSKMASADTNKKDGIPSD